MKDYVIYGDTDSIYIGVYDWLKENGMSDEKWDSLSQEQKVDYTSRIAKEVENYVNEKSFEETQKKSYNSVIDNFPVTFEQEKIAYSGLFIAKKRYATLTLLDEGKWKNEVSTTGIEIVRSETPTMFRIGLQEVLEMLLKGASDSELKSKIDEYKKKAKEARPEDISSNTSINGIHKYINDDFTPKKGAPLQLTGTANYKKLLRMFGLQDKYEDISESEKAHVIYVKPNPFGVGVISFNNWPQEFTDAGIVYDTDIMIEKFFSKKLRFLLQPMGRENILDQNSGFDLFFK